MKNINLFIITLFLIFLSSCRSVKDLTYLQDIANKEIIAEKGNVIQYKIRIKDNLYVNIKTIDPEVNQLFTPAGETRGYMSGTQQMYGNEVSQYINGYQVDSIGEIELPMIGKIKLEGLTLDQAKNKIYQASLEYLEDPVVNIKLLSFRINITGEVQNPGMYYHYQGGLNVLDALSMANGITDEANVKDIMIVRHNGEYTETFKLDLTKKDFFKNEAFYIQPYDMIYVKPGFNKKYSLNVQTYQLILSTISTLVGLQFLYQPIQF